MAQKAPVSAAASKEVVRAAPTKEVGTPGAVLMPLGGFGGRPDWAYFMDDREFAAELQWPRSVEVNERMETTDAQVKGLLLATFLPIRRMRWELDPADSRPEAVALAHEDLNLPVRGDETLVARRGVFNHDRHLGHSLRAVSQGHYHFEEVLELRDDGLLHLEKLGTRPPRSIIGIRTDEHGELQAIEQMAGGLGFSGGRVMGGVVGGIRTLRADRLLAYLWDTADDGDQVGRSVLRSVWRNFLVKDALIRVDAVKHERNAMGIPWFQVDPAASGPQIEDLARKAEEIRASSVGGGAGPGKLQIAGVEGTLPDTIQSIRYHDEQMAKALVQQLFNLGGDANSGARALGDTFAERVVEFQGSIADWYCEATQRFIDRQIERNFGPDEASPQITYTRTETYEVAFADLAKAVSEGLVLVTPELRAYVEERWKIPGQAGAEAPTLPPAPTDAEPGAEPPGTAPKASEGRAQPKRSALAEQMAAKLTAPMTWPQLARAVGSDPKNGTARRARDQLLAEGAVLRETDGTLRPAVALSLPERELKRAPLAFEVAAGVDFAAMEETFLQGREGMMDTYQAARAAQIEQLAGEVEAAEGDPAKLAALSCDPVDTAVLSAPLMKIAQEGVDSARQEYQAQTATSTSAPAEKETSHNFPKPLRMAEANEDEIESRVSEEAVALAAVLATSLAASASRRASAMRSLSPSEAAEDLRTYLGELKGADAKVSISGAVMHSYGIGRQEFMRANGPKSVVGSEILDSNTCQACNGVDGTEYPSIEASEADYPAGAGYIGCEAGLLCRGGCIATY